MKIKMLLIDLELTRLQKRILAGLAVPCIIGGLAAVASADVPHSWRSGELLTAADLNANFEALDERLTDLQSPRVVEDSSDDVESSPAAYSDLVYQGMSLELTPGTWQIDAQATMSSSINADQVQMALWDDTNEEEIPDARSPLAYSISVGATGAGASCPQGCASVNVTTSKVVVITEPTTIRILAVRNGNSRVWVGQQDPNNLIVLPYANRMSAVRLGD